MYNIIKVYSIINLKNNLKNNNCYVKIDSTNNNNNSMLFEKILMEALTDDQEK